MPACSAIRSPRNFLLYNNKLFKIDSLSPAMNQPETHYHTEKINEKIKIIQTRSRALKPGLEVLEVLD